jgi:hypothetical protein
MKQLSDNLLTRLGQADVVCRDCGSRYGKYSVGCSSVWEGTCGVCGETKPITEVRDYGYLSKGINELKGNIKEQSKEVADYMLSVGPIMNDDELEDALTPSYEQGDIECKFTEEEVAALKDMICYVEDDEAYELDDHCETVINKVCALYDDNCVEYELSPALKAYYAKYGTYGTESDIEMARWEGFRDAFVAAELAK